MSRWINSWSVYSILSYSMNIVRLVMDTHVGPRRVLLASVSVSHISWTHTDPPVFLFHRSSNTPSENIKSGLGSTETEREGQCRETERQRETWRKAWGDKEVTTANLVCDIMLLLTILFFYWFCSFPEAYTTLNASPDECSYIYNDRHTHTHTVMILFLIV